MGNTDSKRLEDNHDVLTLAPASEADSKLMFEWRNHPFVRQFTLNPKPLEYPAHCQWLNKTLNDPNRHLLIGKLQDKPVGVLRFDCTPTAAEIHIYLDPDQTHRGIGTRLINAGCDWLKKTHPHIAILHAVILPENLASKKAFQKCGFIEGQHTFQKSFL